MLSGFEIFKFFVSDHLKFSEGEFPRIFFCGRKYQFIPFFQISEDCRKLQNTSQRVVCWTVEIIENMRLSGQFTNLQLRNLRKLNSTGLHCRENERQHGIVLFFGRS